MKCNLDIRGARQIQVKHGLILGVKTCDVFLLRNYCCSSLHCFAVFGFFCFFPSMVNFTGFYTEDDPKC